MGVSAMKTVNLLLVISMATLASAVPLAAQAQSTDQSGRQQAEIIQRGPDGRASVVRIGGRDYPVCTGAQQDGCIEPRTAGLKWGDRPLSYWPGKPASEINGDQGHIPK
jgi:hypothetical protein